MRTIFVLFCTCPALVFTACTGVVPAASDLQPPWARVMKAPEVLPDVPKGQDLYQSDTRCSAAYVRETGKLRSLQGWARTVLKKD
jgi:hypothetical protein